MHLLKWVFIFSLFCFFLKMSLPLKALAFDEKNCPKQKDSMAYQHRDGNRCEGIKPGKISARTHAELVSVTLRPDYKTSQTLPDILMLKFYKRTNIYNGEFLSPYNKIQNETIAVQELTKNYCLDSLTPQEAKKFLTFQWSTEIINQLKIGLNKLHGRATDADGVFVPVIIAHPSYSGDFHYEFGILDKGKFLKFISFDIYDKLGNIRIENVKIEPYTSLPRKDFISVTWDGMQNGKPLNPGIYSVRFKVKIEDERGSTSPLSKKYKFLHDPDLLRQK